MKVATGLASGLHPMPELAEEAARMALKNAGLERAEHVILLLSREYTRQPRPAILAAARAAGCLQVSGCTANGLFTEHGWQIDQPAAAALVFSTDIAATVPDPTPLLSFSGHGTLPYDWQTGPARAGLLDVNAAAWVHGQVSSSACAEFHLPGLRSSVALSTGLRALSEALPVEQSEGYELRRVGGHKAADCLLRALPPELREFPPLHQIALLRRPNEPAIAILSANADGSLTLSTPLQAGEKIIWAIRQPLAAEQDMRQTLKAAAEGRNKPAFGLMFSCIGRGPLFYGDDDHDLLAFREMFPETPLLGAYGSGQIVPVGATNQLFHNSVITLLYEPADV